MKDSILYTDRLSVGYDKKILIEDINIKISAGKIFTLIGANGAGKSTILKSISKQLELISGTVYINTKNINLIKNREFSKSVSIMMTERINPELMTCRDIIEYGRYPYTGQFGTLSEYDKNKVDEAIRLVNAEEIAEKNFNFISDGQKQRVMLAKAICQEPDILILDEPTSFLDIYHKLELFDILKKLVYQKNIAVIMSLHEIDFAQKISDYIICINGDKIDRIGTPEEIFSGEYISRLYNIPSGIYNEYYGTPELKAVTGNPEVFVISGQGRGINTYRRLQRLNIPFSAGIIHENDIEYPVAKALASELVSEKAFEPIGEDAFKKALDMIDSCKKVICCLESFGTMNNYNRNLFEYSKEKRYLNIL